MRIVGAAALLCAVAAGSPLRPSRPDLSIVRRLGGGAAVADAVAPNAAVTESPNALTIHPLTLGRLMVVIAYGKYGVLYPFLPVYYKSIGLPTWCVGAFAMIWPVMMTIGGPFVTGLADRWDRHKSVFITTQLFSAALVAGMFAAGAKPLLILPLLISWSFSDAEFRMLSVLQPARL